LEIADGTYVKKPIELRFDNKSDELRLAIHIGKNAKATVIERFESEEDLNIHYQHQVIADSDSQLRVITVQNLTDKSKLTEIREVRAAKSANVHLLDFQLGGKEVRGSLKQNALGEAGNLNIDLLCRTKGNQNHHFNLTNAYHAKNGHGKVLVKGLAQDAGQLTLNGTIQIDKTGTGTDTYLKQDCLLLSKKANIKSTPALKIDTDNVKAGHGASITNINKESLFYLTSRGLSPYAARKMLINGFVAEVVNKISDLPRIKNYLIANI
jgi:Fe-S cluster assembly protein SufD